MNCSQCCRLASRFLEGDLLPRTRKLVQSHLDSCPDCRMRFHQISLLLKELVHRETAQLPPHFLPGLSHLLDKTRPAPAGGKLVPRLVLGLTSLLIVVLSVCALKLRKPAPQIASAELRMPRETLYLSPSEPDEGGEAFSIRGRSLNGDSVVYLLPHSPPGVRTTLTSY